MACVDTDVKSSSVVHCVAFKFFGGRDVQSQCTSFVLRSDDEESRAYTAGYDDGYRFADSSPSGRMVSTHTQTESESHGAAVVLARCGDGSRCDEIVMPMDEFERVVRAGNAMRAIVGAIRPEGGTCDVFRRFGVAVAEANLIRACVRLGRLPDDDAARASERSGALREAACALGGFSCVDRALAGGE